MREKTKQIAVGGIMTALCVVLMLLGAVLELGIYAAPMLAGLILVPLGDKWGRKYQAILWVAVSILSFLLIPNIEENLMFFGLFGWYPVLRPLLEKLPKVLRLIVKLLLFNAATIAIEALVLLVFVPESLGTAFLLVLLLLGNVIFLIYDLVIPRMSVLLARLKKRT